MDQRPLSGAVQSQIAVQSQFAVQSQVAVQSHFERRNATYSPKQTDIITATSTK